MQDKSPRLLARINFADIPEQHAGHPRQNASDDNGLDEEDASALEELLEGGVIAPLQAPSQLVSTSLGR